MCHPIGSIVVEEDMADNSTNDSQEGSSDLSRENQNLVEDWDSHENQLQDIHLQSSLDTIINNKSSKKIYKAVAEEWGITCKMSDQCRCIDCQGNYFDCEYDEVHAIAIQFPFGTVLLNVLIRFQQNELHKSDGGLGASTPVFLNEVMHHSACTII